MVVGQVLYYNNALKNLKKKRTLKITFLLLYSKVQYLIYSTHILSSPTLLLFLSFFIPFYISNDEKSLLQKTLIEDKVSICKLKIKPT